MSRRVRILLVALLTGLAVAAGLAVSAAATAHNGTIIVDD